MLCPWNTVSSQQPRRTSFILTLFLNMSLRPFIEWSNIITRWINGCHWYTWNFTLTRFLPNDFHFCVYRIVVIHELAANGFVQEYLFVLLLTFSFLSFSSVQICRALSYIHNSIGVCHRDIKPQNLLVRVHSVSNDHIWWITYCYYFKATNFYLLAIFFCWLFLLSHFTG